MDVKALLQSKTILGIVGALAVSLTGGGDLGVILTVGGKLYDLGNVSPYIVSALSALGIYGRLVAPGPILSSLAEPKQDDDSRGFPRAS